MAGMLLALAAGIQLELAAGMLLVLVRLAAGVPQTGSVQHMTSAV